MPRMSFNRGDSIGCHVDYDGNNKVVTIRPFWGPYDAAFRITLQEMRDILKISELQLRRKPSVAPDESRGYTPEPTSTQGPRKGPRPQSK
jgi:hypothetical protein